MNSEQPNNIESDLETDKVLAYKLEIAGRDAAGSILSAVGSSGASNHSYAVKLRVKKADDLVEKKARKILEKKDHNSKFDYKIQSITDVIGLRVVTLFKSELAAVVRELLLLIHSENSPFKTGHVEEAIIYAVDEDFSSAAGKIERVFVESGIDKRQVLRRKSVTGYSSIHLITRIGGEITTEEHSALTGYEIPVEIQVRTVFEDAWGEIDHAFNYSTKRISTGRKKPKPKKKLSDAEQRSIANHLRTLKHFTDSCAVYADAIQQDFEQVWPATLRNIVQIDEDIETLERLTNVGVDSELIQIFKTIGEEYQPSHHDNQIGFDSDPNILAAEAYAELAKKTVDHYSEDSYVRKEFLYFVRMNEALSRMRTRARSEVVKALELYSNLVDEFPKRPTPAYRIAMANRELENNDEAVELFDKAVKLFSITVNLPSDERTEHLMESEAHILNFFIPKGYGYAWWQKSCVADNTREQRIAALQKAHDSTLVFGEIEINDGDSESVREVKIDCINNLLSYACEILQHTEELPEIISDDLSRRRIKYQDLLVDHIDYNVSTDLLALDTLSSNFLEQNEIELARKYAERILDLTLPKGKNRIQRQLTIEETEIAAQAVDTIRR